MESGKLFVRRIQMFEKSLKMPLTKVYSSNNNSIKQELNKISFNLQILLLYASTQENISVFSSNKTMNFGYILMFEKFLDQEMHKKLQVTRLADFVHFVRVTYHTGNFVFSCKNFNVSYFTEITYLITFLHID